MTRRLLTGLASLSLISCAERPVLLSVCPPIPASLLAGCSDPPYVPRDSDELWDQWGEGVVCNREVRVRLAAIAELSDCRVEAVRRAAEPRAGTPPPR